MLILKGEEFSFSMRESMVLYKNNFYYSNFVIFFIQDLMLLEFVQHFSLSISFIINLLKLALV